MSDLVEVHDAQAAHSPKERWGNHTGAQINCLVKIDLTEQIRGTTEEDPRLN